MIGFTRYSQSVNPTMHITLSLCLRGNHSTSSSKQDLGIMILPGESVPKLSADKETGIASAPTIHARHSKISGAQMSDNSDSDVEGGGEIEPFSQEREGLETSEGSLSASLSSTMPQISVLTSKYPPFLEHSPYILILEQHRRLIWR
jgi:hypothetical protein